MKFKLEFEVQGRIRINLLEKHISIKKADILQYYLEKIEFVKKVKIYERTGSVAILYDGRREDLIYYLQKFSYEKSKVPEVYLENSGRELDRYYREKIMTKVIKRYTKKLFMPKILRGVMISIRTLKYVKKAVQSLLKGKIEVEVLDGAAVSAAVLRGDFKTAGSIMFLLGIGEILEEWTHKKSVEDLARSMSLNTPRVWKVNEKEEELVDSANIVKDDLIKVYAGNVIPFDGVVYSGEAMVNEASLTGEPLSVPKDENVYVYAGTVVEEGEIIIKVKETSGTTKFEKIVKMIEETEKLKSSVESKAENLADRLVPYTFLGTGLVYAISRNITKAMSVLMVDYSCALKLSMPITVLSAIKEAREYNINVKGGKFLEAVAEADTIVFDKTGTLTEARPKVYDIVTFDNEESNEVLRIAACLEEHFPHSMAKAVVNEALEKGITHAEMHSSVEYIVAHGIASKIDEKRVIIGSYHFVFEDENSEIPEGQEKLFENISDEYSHLYMAIDGYLKAVILIEDPLREEAPLVIEELRKLGFSKIVMMTGDSERTAKAVAVKVGVDEYYSEVLPADKAEFVEKEKNMGRTVIMIGDGINDSPALSASDCGIAISDGAELARDIADVIIGADSLYGVLTLKKLSNELMKKIKKNYREIIGINSGLIIGGVTGVIQPTTSAFLHNGSTIGISVNSMKKML